MPAADVRPLPVAGHARRREHQRAREAQEDRDPLAPPQILLQVEVRVERQQHQPIAEDGLRDRDRQDRQRDQAEDRAGDVEDEPTAPRPAASRVTSRPASWRGRPASERVSTARAASV